MDRVSLSKESFPIRKIMIESPLLYSFLLVSKALRLHSKAAKSKLDFEKEGACCRFISK